MSKVEKAIVIVFLLALTVIGTNYLIINVVNHQGDTAMFLDYIEGTIRHGLPLTRANAAINEASWTWGAGSIDAICQGNLAPAQYDNPGMQINQLTRHAYLIAYPLSILTLFGPTLIVMPFAHMLSFMAVPPLVYVLLRLHRMSIIPAALFTALVMVHPAWSEGMMGNLYSDRFFILFGLLYVVLLYEIVVLRRPTNGWIISALFVCGFLAAATVERATFMTAAATFGFFILFPRKTWSHPIAPALLGFAVLLTAWFVVYMRFISTNPELGSFMSGLLGLPTLWKTPYFVPGTIKFILINVVLFGTFALVGNWRLGLIALGAAVPNLLLTIGGAERSGFGTHYHSLYLPFLIAAGLYGYLNLWQKARTSRLRFAPALACAAMIPIMAGVASSTGQVEFSMHNIREWSPLRMARALWMGEGSSEIVFSRQRLQAAAAVPAGASVTTIEGMMPTLYHDHLLFYYPVGLDQADYAVIQVENDKPPRYYSGAIGYGLNSEALNRCLTERLRLAGYNVDDPPIVGVFAILKRRGGGNQARQKDQAPLRKQTDISLIPSTK